MLRHNILPILLVLESLFFLILAGIVYLKKRRSTTNLAFSLLSLTGTIFLFGSAMMLLAKDDATALKWDRIVYIGVVFIPPSMYHLGVSFAKDEQKNKKWIVIGYLLGIAFLLLSRTGLFLKGIFRYSWGCHGIAQIFHHIFLLVFFSYIVAYLYTLYSYYKKTASSATRNQSRYFFIASFILILSSSQFLPAYKIPFVPVGYFFIGAYLAIIAYTIVKYRLMDVVVVITRAATFLAVYSFVLGIPVIIMGLFRNWFILHLGANWWMGPFTALIALGVMGPFAYTRLEKKAEAIILREQRKYQEILKHTAVDLTRIRNLQQLLDYIARTVTETVKISHSTIYLYEPKEEKFLLRSGINLDKNQPETICKENAIIKYLYSKKDPLVYEEVKSRAESDALGPFKEIEEKMEALNASVVIPCFLEDKLLNIIVLGDKLSGKIYNEDDLNNFTFLASEAALATENAQLYGKIEDEVKTRTEELIGVQKQLVQAEKLATVGTLAGGVAHEINNPLTAILTNVQILLLDAEKLDVDSKESLELIEEATKRCRTIVQKLMTYAKKPLEETQISRINLLTVAQKVASFLEFQMKQDNINITIDADNKEYPVNGNHNELEQVITNMVLNAKDAIRQVKLKGSITISLANNGNRINILIKDDGVGMKKEIIPKIFDPFFTTKEVGKGTGLGLSICQSIIEKHKGTISVESQVNYGTVFNISLPRAT